MKTLSLNASQKTKQTPAGEIPVDWALPSLGQLVSMRSGGTPARSNEEFWSGEKPWFSGKDLKSFRLTDSIEHISEIAVKSGTRLAPINSLLILVRGMTLLKEVPIGLLTRQASFNQDIKAMIPNKKLVDPTYLGYCILAYNRRLQNMVTIAGHGTGRLQLEALTEFPIPLPPLPEQKKIAAILSTWDRAIEAQQALIAAKTERKRGLMQQLLTGIKRLPGFKGKWPKQKFGDFLTESRLLGSDGSTAQKITIKLYGKGVFPKNEVRIGSKNTKYYSRREGQFIYSKLDFLNGAFAILPQHLDGYESTLDLPAFDVNENADPRWLLAYVRRPYFYTKQVGAAAGGRKARRVNPNEFLALSLKTPPIEEQTAIADLLDAASKEITLLTEQLETLREQKRGLMQNLLTGKVRVKP